MPDAPLPLVTVAILAFNRREAVEVNLTKLSTALDWPADRLEVIVVDNASGDGTAEMVAERFPRVQVVRREENIGVPAWNDAFRRGTGDWFLVLDDDCYVEGDALRRAVDAATAHAADLVSFRVLSSDPARAFSDEYRTGVLTFWGCAALVSRRAIDTLGGFDPQIFLWAHEVEFTMRLLDAGMTHLVLPEVTVTHMKPIPAPGIPEHLRNMRHFAYVAGKLLQPADALAALRGILVRASIMVLISPDLRQGVVEVVQGFREGVRARTKPVRPEVSRVYREDFLDFDSHLRFIRGPRQRILDRRRGGMPYARRNLFWERRSLMYPLDRTVAYKIP